MVGGSSEVAGWPEVKSAELVTVCATSSDIFASRIG